MDRLQGRPKPLRRSLWVVGTYLLLGWLWITFSDYLVQQWFPDPEVLGRVQTYKGLLFVLVTGLALFLLLIQQFTNDRKLLSLYRHQREENRELSQFRESVIERANVWINVLDTEGRVVLWNKAAEDISGYPREAVIGSDEIWQLLYPDEENRIRIRERANEILRDEGEVVGYETWITTRDGRERQLSWNSRSPVLVPQPKLPIQRKLSAKNAPIPSISWSLRSRMITAFTFTGSNPKSRALRIAISTSSSPSRPVSFLKFSRSSESKLKVTLLKPALRSASAWLAKQKPLVVRAIS
mgnify:CR=1 FL=1